MRNTRKSGQILRSKKRPRPTGRSGTERRTNSNTSHQIPARVIEAENANIWLAEIAISLSQLAGLSAGDGFQEKQHERSSCQQNLYSLSRGNSSTHARAS